MPSPLTLSREQAANLLAHYHLRPASVAGVFDRLGSVQYDPLNPVGRNIDLVFQARVQGYKVDDWHTDVYEQRIAYDAWDKQACLVPVADWPWRFLIRDRFHPWHDRTILQEYPDVVRETLAEIDRRGPLSSLEFTDRSRVVGGHSWLGPTRVKRILRALWARGEVVTHHRQAGRHYYDRPERVVPLQYFSAPPVEDLAAYQRWIVRRRHQAAGLLRSGASAEIWSVCGTAMQRTQAVAELVDQEELIPVRIGDKRDRYHMPSDALPLLHHPGSLERVIFLGPLDNMLWDRKAISEIYDFDYIWEVYKKPEHRRWGYYVLPVFWRDRFVARFDARVEGKIWTIDRWWWEEDTVLDSDLSDALRDALQQFSTYLRAEGLGVSEGVDRKTRSVLLPSKRTPRSTS